MAADHGVGDAVVGAGGEHVEQRLVFLLFGPGCGKGQMLLFGFGDDFIDDAVSLHGLFVVLIALKLVQKLKANP